MSFKKIFSHLVMMTATFLSAGVEAAPDGALSYRVQPSSAVSSGKVHAEAYSAAIYYSVSGFAKPTSSVIAGSFSIDRAGQLTWSAGFDGATNLIGGNCPIQYSQDKNSGETTGFSGQCASGSIDPASGTMQFTLGGLGYDVQGKGIFGSWFRPTGTVTLVPKAGYNALGVWYSKTPVGLLFQDETGSFVGSAGVGQSITGMMDSQGRGVIRLQNGAIHAITLADGQSYGWANYLGNSYAIAGTFGNFFAVNDQQQIVATGSVVNVPVNDPSWSNFLAARSLPAPFGFNAILQVNGLFFAGFREPTSARFVNTYGSLITINFGL